MKEIPRELYKRVSCLHSELHQMITRMKQDIPNEMNYNELADYAIALKKAAELVDDTRKELDALNVLSQSRACMFAVNVGDAGPIKTDYVTATLDTQTAAHIPTKSSQPEAFRQLMQSIGIPEHLIADVDGTELIKPHWPGLLAYFKQLEIEGKPLPKGIDPNKTYTIFRLSPMRAKKPII